MLLMSSGASSALAHKTKKQPTNNAQSQYTEVVPPTISGRKHHGRHTSGAGRTTGTGQTSTTHKHTKASSSHHHKNRGRKGKHHTTRKHVKHNSAVGNHTGALASKSGHTTGRLTAAVTSSSGGGISVWLLVILILVLVSGSVAGVLRYRRSR